MMRVFFVFIFTCFISFGMAIPNYEDFSMEKPGFVVKLNGDTLKGNLSILEPLPSTYINKSGYLKNNAELQILMTPKSKDKIFLKDLKFIQYGKDAYKVFTFSAFPYGSYIAIPPDTLHIVNIYKAFEFDLENAEPPYAFNNNNKFPSVSSFTIKELYIIQIGNLQPEIFYSPTFKYYPYTIRDMNFKKFEPEIEETSVGLNYKKRLKDLFYYKPDAYAYIKSLKNISYDMLPAIVREINKMYK
jgi:hypothetical protein